MTSFKSHLSHCSILITTIFSRLESKRTVTFLMPNFVGRCSETLAAESALVLTKFPVYRCHVDIQVARVGQIFTAQLTLRFQSAGGSCRK